MEGLDAAARPPSYHDNDKAGASAGNENTYSGNRITGAGASPTPVPSNGTGGLQAQDAVRSRLFVISLDQRSPRRLRGISLANDAFTSSKLEAQPHKRYEFVFPPCYQDVKVFPSICTSSTKSMPQYYISLLGGLKKVASEPIIVLRARSTAVYDHTEEHGQFDDPDASRLAALYEEQVCKLVEREIGQRAGFMEFTQSVVNYIARGRDSAWITPAMQREAGSLVTDMEGSSGLAGATHLLRRLEEYLAFIGSQSRQVAIVARSRAIVDRIKSTLDSAAQKQRSMQPGTPPGTNTRPSRPCYCNHAQYCHA